MRGVRTLFRSDFAATGIGRRLVGLAAFGCLSLGAASGAAALSLDEFYRLSAHQKENFISTVLHFQHYRYGASPATAQKARCMVELDRAEAESGEPYLYSQIMRDLDVVRTSTAGGRTVEKVIGSVIDRECKGY